MHNMLKPRWLVEVIAVWGYVQRNYFLTKRYFMWELVWLTFTTVNAMSITFIGAGVELVGAGEQAASSMSRQLIYSMCAWNMLRI